MSDVVSYIFSSFLLQGALLALKISALAMGGGLLIGLGLAVLRLSPIKPISAVT